VRASTEPRRSGTGWRELAVFAAVATTAVIIITAVVADIYLLLISALLLGIGAVLTRRRGRAGPILLVVVAALFLLVNGPFVVPYLTAPASWLNFILTSLALLGCIVTLFAAAATMRRRDDGSSAGPRTAGWIALALAALLIGVGVVAAIAYHAPAQREGDLRLSTKNLEFSPAGLEASPGQVSVFVSNQDGVLHTFTIDRLQVNLNVPASSTARITFRADPGSYHYICRVHPDMEGTLVVR
jgi:plastocyanin